MLSGSEPLIFGLTLGAASAFSIGPNNLMLIREGLVGGRVGFVATSVWASYVSLLAAALFLAGSAATETAPVRTVLAVLSLAAISFFAVQSLRSAFRAGALSAGAGARAETFGACFCRVFAVIWLNPLTYIELLLIPASLCDRFEHTDARLLFIFGVVAVETLVCYGYSFGAAFCAPVLRHRRSLQVFDLASGLVMAGMAVAMAAAMAAPGA